MHAEGINELLESSLKKVAEGTGLVLAGTIIGILLNLINTIIVVRYISVTEFGVLSLAMAVVSILGSVSLLGFQESVPRYISYFRGSNDNARLMGTIKASIILSLTTGLTLSIIVFFLSCFLAHLFGKPALIFPIKVLVFIIPTNAFTAILVSIFRGFEDVKPKIYFQNIINHVIKLLMLGLAIILGLSFLGILFAYLTAAIGVGILIGVYSFRKIPTFIPKTTKPVPMIKGLLFFSLPLLAVIISSLIMNWTDTLMLGYFKTSDVVGLYNVALPLAMFISIILSALAFIYTPIISYLYSKDLIKEIGKVYASATKWIFIITFPLFLILLLFPHLILQILFGSQYVKAHMTLQILALGYFAHTLFGPNILTLLVMGKTKLIMANTLIGAIINIVFNFILIPKLGLEGAAIASTSSLFTVNILTSYQLFKFFDIHPFKKNYLKPVGVSAVLATVFYGVIIKFSLSDYLLLPIAGGIFMLLSLISLPLTKSIEEEDIVILKNVIMRLDINSNSARRILQKFSSTDTEKRP